MYTLKILLRSQQTNGHIDSDGNSYSLCIFILSVKEPDKSLIQLNAMC